MTSVTLRRSQRQVPEKSDARNEKGRLDGDFALRQEDGGHTDAPNIPHFIKWATSRFKEKVNSAE